MYSYRLASYGKFLILCAIYFGALHFASAAELTGTVKKFNYYRQGTQAPIRCVITVDDGNPPDKLFHTSDPGTQRIFETGYTITKPVKINYRTQGGENWINWSEVTTAATGAGDASKVKTLKYIDRECDTSVYPAPDRSKTVAGILPTVATDPLVKSFSEKTQQIPGLLHASVAKNSAVTATYTPVAANVDGVVNQITTLTLP